MLSFGTDLSDDDLVDCTVRCRTCKTFHELCACVEHDCRKKYQCCLSWDYLPFVCRMHRSSARISGCEDYTRIHVAVSSFSVYRYNTCMPFSARECSVRAFVTCVYRVYFDTTVRWICSPFVWGTATSPSVLNRWVMISTYVASHFAHTSYDVTPTSTMLGARGTPPSNIRWLIRLFEPLLQASIKHKIVDISRHDNMVTSLRGKRCGAQIWRLSTQSS